MQTCAQKCVSPQHTGEKENSIFVRYPQTPALLCVHIAVVSWILKTKLHLPELPTSVLRRGYKHFFFKHIRVAVYILETFRPPLYPFPFPAFPFTRAKAKLAIFNSSSEFLVFNFAEEKIKLRTHVYSPSKFIAFPFYYFMRHLYLLLLKQLRLHHFAENKIYKKSKEEIFSLSFTRLISTISMISSCCLSLG